MTNWQSRFTSNEIKYQPADQFVANPDNPREHPGNQREGLIGSLDTLGWVAPVIVNRRNGYLLDGHARIEEALTRNDAQTIPFIEVDLDEAEEAQFLTTFDWLTTMACYNRDRTEAVMQRVQSDDQRVQEMIAAQAEMLGVVFADDAVWGDVFDSLPDSDRSPFQQMTFTLHDTQTESVKKAIRIASSMGDYSDTENENGNGNALARICEVFIAQHG